MRFNLFREALTTLDRRDQYRFFAILAAALLIAFLQALGVTSILPFLGLLANPDILHTNTTLAAANNWIGPLTPKAFLNVLGAGMLLLIVLTNATMALTAWLRHHFVWDNNHKLSTRLLETYLDLPYAFFLDRHSSDLSRKILAEVNQLTKGFFIPALQVVTQGILLATIVALLFLVNWRITLIALTLFGIPYVILYAIVRPRLARRGEERFNTNKLRFKVASEAFSGIKEIKVTDSGPEFLKRYRAYSETFARLRCWSLLLTQLPQYGFQTIAFGGAVAFVLVLLHMESDIGDAIPLLGFYAIAGARLLPALSQLFQSFSEMKFAAAAIENVRADLARGAAPAPDGQPPAAPLPFEKHIALKNVSFTYPGSDAPVLTDLGLSILKGRSVAFVGPTGSGKTTIVDLLLGLLSPQTGALTVDGVEVTDANRAAWQRRLGYVPQHIFLADDTVAANIAFGLPRDRVDRNAVEAAARVAQIHDFIVSELPNGYDTEIGEQGVRLSGGQRQRIGIARAVYRDPDVLVLDEATSALDNVTEESVYTALEDAARDRTLIVIAHRLSTIRSVDCIYVLERGAIRDSGTFDELLARSDTFRALARETNL